jgi:catechol 2,3-dioxygenase-like lactoylglutathione lyase family enzyme
MGITAIAHVTVLSDDIDATRDFYCETLGLTPGERPPLPFPGHWLYGDAGPLVHIADRSVYLEHARELGLPEPPAAGPPVDHIAFAASDYDEASARLERRGVAAVRNRVPGAGLRQLFFSDPGGVRIEIGVTEGGG